MNDRQDRGRVEVDERKMDWGDLKIKLQEANHMIVRGPRHFDFLTNTRTRTRTHIHTKAGYCYQ